MSQRDYYEILNVSRTASEGEIRQAYRKLAMKYHPDRNPGDAEAEAKFKEAAEAYEVLRDPEKRSRYDSFGHAGVGGAGQGFGNAEDIFSHFSDIFGDLFGFSTAGGPRAEAGHDLRYNLDVTFMQAARGAEITLKIPKRVTCPDCDGLGAASKSDIKTCKTCRGSGQLRRGQGFFQLMTPCPACGGSGKTIAKACPRCKGDGAVRDTREISLKIPPGVDNGTRLRVRGEGEPGSRGGPAGDLYVDLSVDPDPRWRREGANLVVNQDISFVQAALGHRVEIPGLDGPITLEIPRGVQSGQILRVPGEGMPLLGREKRGDLLTQIKVLTPTDLTERQEELLREFESAGEEGTFAKVKKAARKIGKAMGLD